MKRILYLILAYKGLSCLRTNKISRNGMRSRQLPYDIEVAAENLFVPWAVAVSDDGKIYFTERSGAVRVIEGGTLNPKPLITFESPFVSQVEGGLMGIALDPDFLNNHYMYVMYSYAENSQLFNRVVRLIENNNSASIDKVLLDKIPGGIIHNGGRIKIGPDQKLYITTGDIGSRELAQDLSSTGGKILRINLDGTIPTDNPFEGSPIYSYGHRDPQGIAWNADNKLYASEHGQTAHDEINLIKPGSNYGWPLVQGDEDLNNMNLQKPLIHSGDVTWAPSGMTFISQGPWKGKLVVAALRGSQLLVFTLNEDGTKIQHTDSLFQNEYGRLREAVEAKDGSIYLTTSNRDGRGNPSRTDDKIIRLVPKSIM